MTIKLPLLLSAATFLWAGGAVAQTTYSTGSTYASQPSSARYQQGSQALPDLSPDRIAADVIMEYNPRTGQPERVAPTFDPFEDDDRLAASVNLRSTDYAFDLNNDRFDNGVLLEVDLYYTDYGDRDFGRTRDALFLNGEPVPIVRRDSRELECSSRVSETVYHYDRYYSPGYGGLHRSRPRYWGHRGFGYDRFDRFGYDYGRGGYYPRHPRPRPRTRPRRPERPRAVTRGVEIGSPRAGTGPRTGRPARVGTDYMIGGRPAGSKPRSITSPGPRGGSGATSPRDERPRTRGRGTDRGPSTRGGGGRDLDRDRRRREPATHTERKRTYQPDPISRPRRDLPDRRPSPPVRPSTTTTPPPSRPKPPVRTSDKPRTVRPDRPVRKPRPDSTKRVQFDLFPGSGYGDAVVVSRQRDCAREDQLVVFIPNDRLDAARFDGLTLIIRDVTYDPRTGQTTVYDERPLYIPPNYIEGFQIASRRP